MEAVINSCNLPASKDNVILYAERTWSYLTKQLHILPSAEMKLWVDFETEYLQSLLTPKEEAGIQKFIIGLYTIFHFYVDNLSKIQNLVDALFSFSNEAVMDLSAIFIVKIAKESYKTDDSFTKRGMKVAFDFLKNRVWNFNIKFIFDTTNKLYHTQR